MPVGEQSDEAGPEGGVLSKVDALLRRYRGGGLDTEAEVSDDADVPTLTEVLEEPGTLSSPGTGPDAGIVERAPVAEPGDAATLREGAPEVEPASDPQQQACSGAESPTPAMDQAWLGGLQPRIERAVADAIAAQLPRAIQEQVMPEVMLALGEASNRLRDAMRDTVRGVVQETIEQEVKRALKALLRERVKR
jgi:hypothetical protein